VGRFGPYVKYGAKYVSLKTDDPYEITPERALEVIREKEIADANRLILDFPDAGIQVLNGRYGPYITDKARNAKIPKDKEPKSLTLEECQALLAAAPERGKWGRKGAKGSKFTPKAAAKGGKAAKGAKGVSAAPAATPTAAAPVKLAAKGKKTAVNKRAPVKPAVSKTRVKVKKRAAKKKS
jgi:DNA topoisomerase-1